MALLHHAELRPSKVELISEWLPAQPWFVDAADSEAASSTSPSVSKVASFRFDDPAGEVGIETLLVRAGDGPVMQVPLTYRAAALPGAEASLIGTIEHSVLGTRWTYDGCGDPVYVAALALAIVSGGDEATQYYEADGVRTTKADTTHVHGSGRRGAEVAPLTDLAVSTDGAGTRGAATVIESSECRLAVLRYPTEPRADTDGQTLVGAWDGLEATVVLATARMSG